eukprot:264980_1
MLQTQTSPISQENHGFMEYSDDSDDSDESGFMGDMLAHITKQQTQNNTTTNTKQTNHTTIQNKYKSESPKQQSNAINSKNVNGSIAIHKNDKHDDHENDENDIDILLARHPCSPRPQLSSYNKLSETSVAKFNTTKFYYNNQYLSHHNGQQNHQYNYNQRNNQ